MKGDGKNNEGNCGPCLQIKLPPLVGMLFAGVLLRNLPGDPVQGLPYLWAGTIRVGALSVIFIRSGLGLNWRAFKSIGWVALRLTVIPCVCEAVVVALVAMALFKMEALLAFALGFMIAAISVAVIVNGYFALQKTGYGVLKSIPSLCVASASFDVVVAITGYSLFIGLALPSDAFGLSVSRGPLTIILGVSGGVFGGLVLSATSIWVTRGQRSLACFLMGQLLMAMFSYADFKGSGALASLFLGITAMIAWEQGFPKFWSKGPCSHYTDEVEADLAVLWKAVAMVRDLSLLRSSRDLLP
jgi:hypothetical protein